MKSSRTFSTNTLAMLLIFALLVTSMSLSTFATESASLNCNNNGELSSEPKTGVVAKGSLEEATEISEVVSRREENVKHFYVGNGLYQAITYGTAIHRRDANGEWQDIDNRLFLDSKNNIYSTADGRTKVAVAVDTDIPLVSINENGYIISMTPITTSCLFSSAEVVNHQIRNYDTISGLSIDEFAEIENASSVKYANVFDSTDIEYILDSNDIKEKIIIKSHQSSYEYSFRLSVKNLVPVLNQTGEIVFLDSESTEEEYHIPTPYMFDCSCNISYEVYYRLNEDEYGFIVTVVANTEWINDSDRVFPITIDPTIQKSIVFDTYINSSSPATNYGSSSELWISSERISFLRCSMPTIPAGCSFYAANLYVYYYYHSNVTTGGLTAGAYQVLNSWVETGTSGLTWEIAQPNTSTYISATRLSTGYLSGSRGAYISSPKTVSFNVTTAAASWYVDSNTNYGIALKYESGNNASVIIKSYEAGMNYRAFFVITYTEPQIISGIYRIQNAQNGMYLDTTGGGYSAGTKIQQWSRNESDTNRSQLFKITFVRTVGSSTQLNYYTIRPMTNSAMGLESSLSGTERDLTIESISITDDWINLLYNHLWAISKNGSTYTIKNGNTTDTSYLTAPSNSINGETVFTSDTTTNYSKWVLERYTGEDLYGVDWQFFASSLIVGEHYHYKGYMYDSDVGKNGPIQYSVTNTDGSETDKATINSSSGFLYALKPGQIRVRMTYDGAPWIWYWTVTITPSYEGSYFFSNAEFGKYMQINNNSPSSLDGAFFELWDYDGASYQEFNIVYLFDGYYKIVCAASDKVLTAPSSLDSNIVQYDYSGLNTQKWKVVRTNEGVYRLSPKSNESSYMAAGEGIISPYGRNIELRSESADMKDEWFLIKNCDIRCVGVQDDSHISCDHTCTFPTVEINLYNRGFQSYEMFEYMTADTLCSIMTSTEIVVTNSHGTKTKIVLNDSDFTVSKVNALPNNALEALQLVVFVACETGKDGVGANNLVNAMANKGAQVVIGFEKTIYCQESDIWVIAFFNSLGEGDTIDAAIRAAKQAVLENWLLDITTDPCYSVGNLIQTIDNN